MALIKCSECGKEISDKASACPKCGYKISNENTIKKKKKIESINNGNIKKYCIISLIVLIIIILAIFCYFKFFRSSYIGSWEHYIQWVDNGEIYRKSFSSYTFNKDGTFEYIGHNIPKDDETVEYSGTYTYKNNKIFLEFKYDDERYTDQLIMKGKKMCSISDETCQRYYTKDNSKKNITINEENLETDSLKIIENAQAESAAVKDKEKGEFKYIGFDEYLELYAAKQYSLVLFVNPTDNFCEIAEKIIRKLIYTHGIDIKYLNMNEFNDAQFNEFIASNELFNDGVGMPLLLLVGNNEILDTVDGLTDTAHYKKFLQENGFIK